MRFLIDLTPQVRMAFLEPHAAFRDATQPNARAFDERSRSALKRIRYAHVPRRKSKQDGQSNLHAKGGREAFRSMGFVTVQTLNLLGSVGAHANFASIESILCVQLVAKGKHARKDDDIEWRNLWETVSAALVATIQMLEWPVEPFSLERALHGNAPVLRSEEASTS